jgi:hypothetical protein
MERAIEKAMKAERLHSIRKKPKKDAKNRRAPLFLGALRCFLLRAAIFPLLCGAFYCSAAIFSLLCGVFYYSAAIFRCFSVTVYCFSVFFSVS